MYIREETLRFNLGIYYKSCVELLHPNVLTIIDIVCIMPISIIIS